MSMSITGLGKRAGVLVAVALVVAACSSSATQAPATQAPATAAPATAAPATAAPATQAPVESAAPVGGSTTVGSNYSDAVPKAAFQAMMDYCTQQTGVTTTINTVEHGAFQDALNSYLQGTPDDIFTWFAGYRMKFFADQGLATSMSDVWAKVGDQFSDAYKTASTASNGEQYFLPMYNYPWVVIYRKSLFTEKGYTVPTTIEEFKTLGDKMKADGLVPLAFGDKDGWPAMGTFDILNMRMNGYDFHVGLMAGTEKWTDPKVKAVFQKWAELLPYLQEGALGRTWQDAAQALMTKKAGMYFLGTFAGEQAPDPATHDDLAFFPFPVFGTAYDAEMGIDAPIDGLMLSKTNANPDANKTLLECLASPEAELTFLKSSPNNVAANKNADTSGYTDFQKQMQTILAGSNKIAQFLDRDTRPDFAGPNGMQGFLQDFLGNPTQDLDAYLGKIQSFWDSLPPQ
jgi:multiple sugar transport system substrate-binding protein